MAPSVVMVLLLGITCFAGTMHTWGAGLWLAVTAPVKVTALLVGAGVSSWHVAVNAAAGISTFSAQLLGSLSLPWVIVVLAGGATLVAADQPEQRR
jgi:hypothetical protein